MKFMLGVAVGVTGTTAAIAGMGLFALAYVRKKGFLFPESTGAKSSAEQVIDTFRREIGEVVRDPDEWLNTPNASFGLRAPADLIKDGAEQTVRSVLNAIKHTTNP